MATKIAKSFNFGGDDTYILSVDWDAIDGKPEVVNGQDGKDGADGVSPTVTVSTITGGHRLTITDKNGTKTVDIMDGADGEDGQDGQDGQNGKDGQAGQAGADGERGHSILKVTTAPTSYTTATGGKNPIKRMALSTIKTQAKVDEVLVGDQILYSYYLYNIYYLDASYAYMDAYTSIRGATGAAGKAGADGYTPVKGTDYYTDADKAEMVEVVKDSLDPPDYVVAEAESVIDRVIAAQGTRTFTFAAISDLHFGSWGYYEGVTDYPDGIKHACQALKYIDERVKLDAVAVLGDYTDGMAYDQHDTAVYDFKNVNAVLDKLRFAPNLRLVGNHDFHTEHSPLTYRYIGAYSDGGVEWGDRLGGYYRKDFDAYKLRVICLNTSEQNNTSLSTSVAQYEWFVSSLDLSGKDDASEWGILILSHIPLDMWANNGEYRFAYILDAYKGGTSWTDGTVSCDFSGKNAAKIVANIHGHVHNCKTDKLYLGNIEASTTQTSVWRMATPNACYGAENKNYAGYQEDTAYTKTANSATDTAFCVYCIDLDTYTIKAICYGAGYDRELTYAARYTNQIPISTGADDSVYNGVGYKANTRWSTSSNVEKEYTGVYITGYIPVTYGDVVRLRNITLVSGGAENKVQYFEQKGAWVFTRDATAHDDYVLDSSGNLIQFSADMSGFIRVQGSYIGDDSIITVNEPIE